MKTLTIALFSLLSLAYAGEPVCQQCDYRPGYNLCDITTSCTFVWGHDDPSTPAPYYCACRAGYRTSFSLFPPPPLVPDTPSPCLGWCKKRKAAPKSQPNLTQSSVSFFLCGYAGANAMNRRRQL